jgi:uncharacterized membrane protein (UPF0127 family)
MKIKLKNSVMEADVADGFFKKMIGLSFSKKRNMLFTMDFEYRWQFWMFGVRYGLKMIFLDKDKRIVDVLKAEPLSLDLKTWKVYTPRKPSKYILETPYDIKANVGDKLGW